MKPNFVLRWQFFFKFSAVNKRWKYLASWTWLGNTELTKVYGSITTTVSLGSTGTSIKLCEIFPRFDSRTVTVLLSFYINLHLFPSAHQWGPATRSSSDHARRVEDLLEVPMCSLIQTHLHMQYWLSAAVCV